MREFLLCFFFGGRGEGYPLLDWLGIYSRADIGSTIGMSDGIRDGKLEGYPLGEWKFGSETRSEVSYYIGSLYGGI